MDIINNCPHKYINLNGVCISCGYEFKVINKEDKMDGQVLKSGEKKDEGKLRWELLSYDAVEGIVKVLTMGAKKYQARNWELGIDYGRVFGALQRHLTAWWRNENNDSESGLSHLDHALCELMFLSAYEKRNMTQFDDRPRKNNDRPTY